MALTLAQIQNLAVEWNVKQSPLILADLLKRSGFLQTALIRKASDGFKHKYKWFTELPTATFRSIGGSVVPTSISKDKAAIDLWNAVIYPKADYKDVEENPGGKNGWVAANMPGITAGFGQSLAKQCFYGTDPTFGSTNGFLGLHQYAKALSNVTAQLGGTTGSRNTLFAVRWEEDDGASIRIGAGDNLINIRDLTPAAPTTTVVNTTTGAETLDYKWLVDAFLALIIPSKTSVAAITQIDATHVPTVTQINDLIDAVDTGSGKIYLYGNNKVRSMIWNLKNTALKLAPSDTDYNVQVLSWNGMADFSLDQNLVSNETTDLD